MVQNIKKKKRYHLFGIPENLICLACQIFSLMALSWVGSRMPAALCKKVFYFDQVPFVYFVCISLTVGNRSKDRLLGFMSEIFPLVFPSKSFIVSSATFRSLIHFRYFVCLMVLKNVLISFFFTCSCPIFPAPFIEEIILLVTNISCSSGMCVLCSGTF